MPSRHLVFIDGLPGSGKSTTAGEIGRRFLGSRVFLECQPGHPLLVGVPDERGAAFADIHEVHSIESFALTALAKFEAFLENAEGGVQYVFDSQPLQSTVRVLGQLDAPEAIVMKFWSDLQDRLEYAKPRLVYFQESDPRHALIDIIRKRGPSWESYVVEAFNHFPWSRARNLSGAEAMIEAFGEYSALTDRLVALCRYPLLTLTARPRSYQERTRALIEWLEGYQVGHGLAGVDEIPTQHK